MKLTPANTALLIVDVQARLGGAMDPTDYAQIIKTVSTCLAVAEPLGLPVIVSEQYPEGLGPTDERLRLPGPALAKTTFSVWQAAALRAALQASGRRQIIVAGMETHICVYQTARDLVEAGFEVHVLADGVASRTAANRRIGLDLMHRAGAIVTSCETALFDMLGEAGGPVFKQVSRLIR